MPLLAANPIAGTRQNGRMASSAGSQRRDTRNDPVRFQIKWPSPRAQTCRVQCSRRAPAALRRPPSILLHRQRLAVL